MTVECIAGARASESLLGCLTSLGFNLRKMGVTEGF